MLGQARTVTRQGWLDQLGGAYREREADGRNQ
jgi:hypothetical protein